MANMDTHHISLILRLLQLGGASWEPGYDWGYWLARSLLCTQALTTCMGMLGWSLLNWNTCITCSSIATSNAIYKKNVKRCWEMASQKACKWGRDYPWKQKSTYWQSPIPTSRVISSLTNQTQPTLASVDHFQYHAQGRKGLVTLGRLPCARGMH